MANSDRVGGTDTNASRDNNDLMVEHTARWDRSVSAGVKPCVMRSELVMDGTQQAGFDHAG